MHNRARVPQPCDFSVQANTRNTVTYSVGSCCERHWMASNPFSPKAMAEVFTFSQETLVALGPSSNFLSNADSIDYLRSMLGPSESQSDDFQYPRAPITEA